MRTLLLCVGCFLLSLITENSPSLGGTIVTVLIGSPPQTGVRCPTCGAGLYANCIWMGYTFSSAQARLDCSFPRPDGTFCNGKADVSSATPIADGRDMSRSIQVRCDGFINGEPTLCGMEDSVEISSECLLPSPYQ